MEATQCKVIQSSVILGELRERCLRNSQSYFSNSQILYTRGKQFYGSCMASGIHWWQYYVCKGDVWQIEINDHWQPLHILWVCFSASLKAILEQHCQLPAACTSYGRPLCPESCIRIKAIYTLQWWLNTSIIKTFLASKTSWNAWKHTSSAKEAIGH